MTDTKTNQESPVTTISMDKKYKTRDGRDVRILCVDSTYRSTGSGEYLPVIAEVLNPKYHIGPNVFILRYSSFGINSTDKKYDLIEDVPETFHTVAYYTNVYRKPDGLITHSYPYVELDKAEKYSRLNTHMGYVFLKTIRLRKEITIRGDKILEEHYL